MASGSRKKTGRRAEAARTRRAGAGARKSRTRLITRPAAEGRLSRPDHLLRDTGMALRRLGKDAGGEVFSVTFPGQSEPEGLIASTPHSLELAVSVPLPDGFELARAQPTTERVLQLLGALNLGLQSRGWQVSPVAHLRGLEAVALSRHLCRELVSAELLRDELLALHAAARRVFEALSEPASRLFVAVRKASGVRHVAPRRQLHRRTPALIPTFDGAATELMLKAARRRQRKGEPQRHRDTETER